MSAPIPTVGLEAYYPLHQTSGDADDQSSNDNDAALLGSAAWDGTENALRVADRATGYGGFNPSNANYQGALVDGWTIGFWAKSTDGTDDSATLTRYLVGQANNRQHFQFGSQHELWVSIIDTDSVTHSGTITTGLSASQAEDWHFYALTFDGYEMALSVDSVFEVGAVVVSESDALTMKTGPSATRIGYAASSSGAYSFDGWMTEFRVYSRALSQSELSAIFSAGMAPE